MFIVTKEIDAENIGKLCRTCLREDGEKMVCVFSGPAGSSLAAKLRTLSCVEVWQGDGLPEKLCDRCVTRAESALLYREQCRAADLALRQAASKVSRVALDPSVHIPKVYSHQKHDYASIESPAKSVKCAECAAVFSNYGELDNHARGHVPFARESRPVQHMNIVECQNPLGYVTVTENNIDKTSAVLENSFVPSSIAENPGSGKNDRASCALHCSLCDHAFVGRSQLMNHQLPMDCQDEADNSCDDESSIVTNDSKIHTLEDRHFSHSIGDHHRSVENSVIENLSYARAETAIEAINYSAQIALENANIANNEETVRDAKTRVHVPSDTSNESRSDGIPRFPNFDEMGIHENVYEVYKNSPKCFKKSHRCNVCEKLFSRRSKLLSHALSHTGEKPFACSICDKAYTSRSKLNAHNRLHTQTNVHRCNVCDKAFPYPSYLAEHSKIHDTARNPSRMKDYECTVCDKRFRLLKNLNIHLRLHTGKGLVHCEICQKAFGKKYNLKVHLRTHGATAHFFKCIYCGKSFATKGNYAEHLRTHTRVKPFKCRVCNKSFSQSSHRKTHELSHDTSKPHQCRLCGKRYKLAAHLRRHTGTHGNLRMHKCQECGQMFSQAFSLKRHLNGHSEARVVDPTGV